MKLRIPDYYKKFRCTAKKCGDNCCIGWGIYIDDDTMEGYRRIEGDLGEKLRRGIDCDEQCFVTDKNGRCAFLNDDNLCDIIINLGESALCDICDRHPRCFEWFGDCVEGGVGLCCEEAARLILSSDGFTVCEVEAPPRLTEEADIYDETFCSFLRNAREKIIAHLLDECRPLKKSLGDIAIYAEKLQDMADEYELSEVPEITAEDYAFDLKQAAELMLMAETIYDTQAGYFKQLFEYVSATETAAEIAPENERELRNTAVYFVWRYFMKSVFSGYIYPRLMIAVFGTMMINAMFGFRAARGGRLGIEDKCRIAKKFSKIAEYSEENLRLIMDNYRY